jgi:hypothetical protein
MDHLPQILLLDWEQPLAARAPLRHCLPARELLDLLDVACLLA